MQIYNILWFCRETLNLQNLQKTRLIDLKWQSKIQRKVLCDQNPLSNRNSKKMRRVNMN